ncbi:hypothetical protein UY3_13533 [Chelonia mydas]|uniref:Uncharacterized protein n=1 Tax=Chelonia mydas TaxID=8469 RepID=M7AX86_CHEMY|nr:hypothetical protein UY3_13533 [Chelonia mydas]
MMESQNRKRAPAWTEREGVQMLFDSFNGDGGNTEAGFGDEDDDDDDEVVDSSQQASGETGFPNSQELFLTLDLEPVPPEPTQGCLLDPAGGEGTSAEGSHVDSSTPPGGAQAESTRECQLLTYRSEDTVEQTINVSVCVEGIDDSCLPRTDKS